MPNIRDHHSSEVVKMILEGDSGAGKTGAIASLCCDYKVFMIDLDNGVDILKSYLMNPTSEYSKRNPKAPDNLYYKTFTDPVKFINGQAFYSKAEAWAKSMEALMDWKEKQPDGTTKSFGSVQSWGPDTILVIDSLTGLSQYALNYHQQMNGGLMKEPTGYDRQRQIGAVQDMIKRFLDMIKDKNLQCNVVMNCHTTFANEMGDAPGRRDDGKRDPARGYPASIGRALAPKIPTFFNNVLVIQTIGTDTHRIYTKSQFSAGQIVNAKSSSPLTTKTEYGVSMGLLEYFRDVKGAKVNG